MYRSEYVNPNTGVPFSGNRNGSLQNRHKNIYFSLAFYHNVYTWYYLISLILHSELFSGLPASLSFDLLMAFPRAFFSHPLIEAKLSLFFYVQWFFLSFQQGSECTVFLLGPVGANGTALVTVACSSVSCDGSVMFLFLLFLSNFKHTCIVSQNFLYQVFFMLDTHREE